MYKGDALDFLRQSFLPKFSGDSNTTKQLYFRHVIVISGLKLGFEGISEILAETSSQLIDLGKHLKDSINQKEIPKDSALYAVIKNDSISSQDVVFVITSGLD